MLQVKNNLAIFLKGDPAKQAIIFIHGFPFDHYMWEEQVNFLSNNYYCVSYDVRGLGESPAGDGQYTMEAFSDDLFSLVDSYNLINPVLCGHSMGGYIAQRAVEKSESTFHGLILCSTKSEADNNDAKLKRAAGIKSINERGVEKYVKEFIPNCFAEESLSKLGDKYKNILIRSAGFSAAGLRGCLLAMAGRTDTTEFLSKIRIPILLVCGEKDMLSPVNVMEKMAENISDSELHLIPGAAHMAPVENAEAVNKVMGDYLARRFKS